MWLAHSVDKTKNNRPIKQVYQEVGEADEARPTCESSENSHSSGKLKWLFLFISDKPIPFLFCKDMIAQLL